MLAFVFVMQLYCDYCIQIHRCEKQVFVFMTGLLYVYVFVDARKCTWACACLWMNDPIQNVLFYTLQYRAAFLF